MPIPLTRPTSRRALDTFLFDDLTGHPPQRGAAGLDHARRFVELLGDPQDHARQVHVAGTAGKGTVATAITQIVAGRGITVATHLSPHVYDVRERFLIDGDLPDWEGVLAAADEVFDGAVTLQDESGVPPSLFASTAALAWLSGRTAEAELLVTEAGIGGRFDASNVIRRTDKISVVTNIGLDHVDVLGGEVAAIAAEKAAIIAPEGVVVVGPQSHPKALGVVTDVASDRNARLVVVDQSIGDWRTAATAVAGAVALELGIPHDPGVPLELPPGRGEMFDVIGHRVVVDGAHNPLKLCALFAGLAEDHRIEADDLTAVVAIGSGKDLGGCAEVLSGAVSRAVVTEFGDPDDSAMYPRSWPAVAVTAALIERGVDVVGERRDHAAAADLAVSSLSATGPLVVTGSFFHLAGVRARLIERGDHPTPR